MSDNNDWRSTSQRWGNKNNDNTMGTSRWGSEERHNNYNNSANNSANNNSNTGYSATALQGASHRERVNHLRGKGKLSPTIAKTTRTGVVELAPRGLITGPCVLTMMKGMKSKGKGKGKGKEGENVDKSPTGSDNSYDSKGDTYWQTNTNSYGGGKGSSNNWSYGNNSTSSSSKGEGKGYGKSSKTEGKSHGKGKGKGKGASGKGASPPITNKPLPVFSPEDAMSNADSKAKKLPVCDKPPVPITPKPTPGAGARSSVEKLAAAQAAQAAAAQLKANVDAQVAYLQAQRLLALNAASLLQQRSSLGSSASLGSNSGANAGNGSPTISQSVSPVSPLLNQLAAAAAMSAGASGSGALAGALSAGAAKAVVSPTFGAVSTAGTSQPCTKKSPNPNYIGTSNTLTSKTSPKSSNSSAKSVVRSPPGLGPEDDVDKTASTTLESQLVGELEAGENGENKETKSVERSNTVEVDDHDDSDNDSDSDSDSDDDSDNASDIDSDEEDVACGKVHEIEDTEETADNDEDWWMLPSVPEGARK